MNKQVNIYDAKTQLSKLVDRAAAGEEIIISRSGRPLAKLGPINPKPRGRVNLGLAKGQIWIAPDFDDLPNDIQRAFEGEDN
jgi:prevent-host-death family protein